MFAQVDTSLERSRDGLGIGLTLVKTLVEMHGGTVERAATGLGRGSEFVVRLPVAGWTPRRRSARRPVAAPAAASGRRILIVDDNEDGAESLAMLLSSTATRRTRPTTALEAIEAAERLRPDVVLLDIGLPKLNGYEVCRRIREQPWGKDIAARGADRLGQEEDRSRSQRGRLRHPPGQARGLRRPHGGAGLAAGAQ